jgi:hypothetical protein
VMLWNRYYDITINQYSSRIRGSVWTRDKVLICLY